MSNCPAGLPGCRGGCTHEPGPERLSAFFSKSVLKRIAAQHRAVIRCDANAKRGTGTGVCDTILDSHGECRNAGRHV